MRWLLAACALLFLGCVEAPLGPPTLDQHVAAAVFEQWALDTSLPEPDCDRLADLQIFVPESEDFSRKCPEEVWGCFRWDPLGGESVETRYPTAVLNPALPAALWASVAAHELLHGFVGCTRLGVGADVFDAAHSDLRVWEEGGPTSVEARVFEELYLRPRF